MSSQISRNKNVTFFDYVYDIVSNTSTFKIPINCIINTFGLVSNSGNTSQPNDMVLRNLNLSYDKYIIWTAQNSSGNSCTVIGFTGSTDKNPTALNYRRLIIKTEGNPFSMVTGGSLTTGSPLDFHIKPNNFIFEEFRTLLSEYEKYIISVRDGTKGFGFTLKDPTLLDNGNITYSDAKLLWTTGDKYNIDINTPNYQKFLEIILTIGTKYDTIKTDLIARFLTPTSLKTYDLTEEGKMTKLLRIYGREFDQLREFIDSLVYINKVTYDKINNIPDQLVKNLSRTFGWDYFSLVSENELVQSFLTINEDERNLNTDLLPAEIDIELWRRILMNTNYFWKAKGTREAIKSIFLLIGIPEPFINITEYIYTVDGKINPNTVTLNQLDFPSNSLPYDTDGYPVAPLETSDFYFQISGDTDSGQAYMDVFRSVGFNLMKTVDNKKSWAQTGATYRIDDTTPQYYQEDSKLVLNTKEVDITLDTARGIEYDVYDYIQTDFAANSSGYTLPFSYVNISLGVSSSQTVFTLPTPYNQTEGNLEVRFNGILLNAPQEYISGTTINPELTEADYTVTGNSFTITNPAINLGNRRDVVQATFIYSGGTHPVSGITVEYIVTRIKPSAISTVIPLPSYPRGDVQVTINGIALTKGTNQFTADYIVDPNNTTGSSQIIISNPEILTYLAVSPYVQVAYVQVIGSNDISARSEVIRVDSFNSSKIYFNQSANKYVYKLNYKVTNASDIKVLIDGIALEPNMDYSVNVMNLYEIFLPKGIRYGTIISVYYLVGGNAYFNPVIANTFGVGDISQLSFLEFIELIQRRMINARNRKTITDFKGGWYPSLLYIYIQYLKRAELPNGDPLQSNGYTFENLYPFLSKYNAFFQRFVDQLLSATIILRRSGLLVRNSVFTKQKFTYKRGVNLYADGSTTLDKRGDKIVQYYGDDGSQFLINQNIYAPVPPPTLYVETTLGVLGSPTVTTGGKNIVGTALITEYGMLIRKWSGYYGYNALPIGLGNLLDGDIDIELTADDGWTTISNTGSLTADHFTMKLTGLTYSTTYQYKAYIKAGAYGFTGNTLQITTPAAPIIPFIQTKTAVSGQTYLGGSNYYGRIVGTGGINIVGYASINYYAVQYRLTGSTTWLYSPTPPTTGPLAVNNFTRTISTLAVNKTYEYRAYMVVNGTPYYGLTKTIHIPPIPTYKPIVTTGLATAIGITSMTITGNTGTSNGNSTIQEFGELYTQIGAYGTTTKLLYENLPTNVKKSSFTGSGGTIPFIYNRSITGLTSGTLAYYRAFACNAVGVGYGAIKTATPPVPKNINLYKTYQNGSDGGVVICRCHNLQSTAMSSIPSPESYTVCLCATLCVPYVQGTGSTAYICVKCNCGSKLYCCIINTQQYATINVPSFTVDNTDVVTIETVARTASLSSTSNSSSEICLRCVTPIVGNFIKGTTCTSNCSYTG
jgi:hypothetical protein